ncbi:hypothetical protein ACFFV7_42135 [Nonomuraea spiralis]|uniref:Uncharacterized protein n=1 Tax=Nonomuraea spiralis TaxID=46182 RepID=A0ABV5ITF9_9ACTN|nr:hypothetical protein [Nonomuraea spiralis]
MSSVHSRWPPVFNPINTGLLKYWDMDRFENFMYVFPGNPAAWGKNQKVPIFTKELIKAFKKSYMIKDYTVRPMEMRAWACIERAENNWDNHNPTVVADKAGRAEIWMKCLEKYLNDCEIDALGHVMRGKVKFSFKVKDAVHSVSATHGYTCHTDRKVAVRQAPGGPDGNHRYEEFIDVKNRGCVVQDPTLIGGLN